MCQTILHGGGGGLVTKSCPTFATPWAVACQAPLSMGFPREEYLSGLPFPSPDDLYALSVSNLKVRYFYTSLQIRR